MQPTIRPPILRRAATFGMAGTLAVAGVVMVVDAMPASSSGGDFSLDFTAAAPFTYDHTTGGGAYDDRTVGKDEDIVESLQAGDFACDDIVTYLDQIVVDDEAFAGAQTVRLTFEFTANTTGQPGAGHVDVLAAFVNYGNVGGEGAGGTDKGIVDDGGSMATLVNEHFVPPGTTPFDGAENLIAVVEVTDLEQGESVVVRIDTRLGCDPAHPDPTGNNQAAQVDSEVIAPPSEVGEISRGSGNQTIPFQQFGELVTNTPTPTPTATATSTATPTPTTTATATPITPSATATTPRRTSTPRATATPQPATQTPVPTSTPSGAPGAVIIAPTSAVLPAQVLPVSGDGSGGAEAWGRTQTSLGAALIAAGLFMAGLGWRRRRV